MKAEKTEKKPAAERNFPPDALSEPPPRRMPPLLRKAWYNLNQAFRRRIAFSGVTPDQFTILRLLSEDANEGMTQRELCTKMCSDPNTMASLLGRMEASGLLERRTHEDDRRAHRVTLAPKGRHTFVELREIAVELQYAILQAIPERRRAQFLEDLERIADGAQEQLQLDTQREKTSAQARKKT